MKFIVLEVGVFVWFIFSAILGDVISIIKKKDRAKADERAGVIIEEINRRFGPRGVQWAYTGGSKMSAVFIDITFNNNAAGNRASYSSIGPYNNNSLPSAPPAYPSAQYALESPVAPSYAEASYILGQPSAPPARPVPETSISIAPSEVPPQRETYTGDTMFHILN